MRPKTPTYPATKNRIRLEMDRETPAGAREAGGRRARAQRSVAAPAKSNAGRKSKTQLLEILVRSVYSSQATIGGTSRMCEALSLCKEYATRVASAFEKMRPQKTTHIP